MNSLITNAGRFASTCTLLSLVACYGTLASLAGLAAIGVVLSLNGTIWAVTITGFATLAAIALGFQAVKRKAIGPFLMAAGAVVTIGYSMFWTYTLVIEVLGFGLLCAAVIWDQRQAGRHASHANQRI